MLRHLASNYTPPTPDIFCDPTGVWGSGAGGHAGTSGDPYVDLKYAVNTALTSNKKLGVRTGRNVDASNVTNNDLNHTAALLNLSTQSNVGIFPWIPNGAPDWPSVITNTFLFGTNLSDWERVSIVAAVNTVVATSGTYVNRGEIDAAGQPYWHYTGAVSSATAISGLGFGDRYSIENIVNPSNYKQHGCAKSHTECGYLDDSGSDCIVNPSTGESNPLDEDMTWCKTKNGGIVIRSTVNPALRWGGVYAYLESIALLIIQDCQGVTYEYPWQTLSSGRILVLKNTLNQVMDASIKGLWGTHVGGVLSLTTGNLAPSMGTGSGNGQGCIDITAGTNSAVFGNNTSPWISADISDIKADYCHGRVLGASGWVKNTRIHDMTIDMSNLQAFGSFCTLPANAPMGSHNSIDHFRLTRIHCGAGKFGRTDYGITFAEENGGWTMHHGIIEKSAGTLQVDGARRNQTVWEILFSEILQGPVYTDEQDDGSGSRQIVNCGVIGDDPANWRISAYGDGTHGNVRWDRFVAFPSQPDWGYPAKGRVNDTDTQSNNDGDFHTNNWWSLGACPAANAYGFQNGTLFASITKNGPWDDVDANGIGTNGEAVTVGQRQVRAVKLSTINGLSHDSGSIAAQRVVDHDWADASAGSGNPLGTQAVTNGVTAAQALTSDGFWTASSPSTCKTGGVVLNPTNVAVAIPYTRVAVNTVDLRGLIRFGNYASFGPYQYVAPSPTTRALV